MFGKLNSLTIHKRRLLSCKALITINCRQAGRLKMYRLQNKVWKNQNSLVKAVVRSVMSMVFFWFFFFGGGGGKIDLKTVLESSGGLL